MIPILRLPPSQPQLLPHDQPPTSASRIAKPPPHSGRPPISPFPSHRSALGGGGGGGIPPITATSPLTTSLQTITPRRLSLDHPPTFLTPQSARPAGLPASSMLCYDSTATVRRLSYQEPSVSAASPLKQIHVVGPTHLSVVDPRLAPRGGYATTGAVFPSWATSSYRPQCAPRARMNSTASELSHTSSIGSMVSHTSSYTSLLGRTSSNASSSRRPSDSLVRPLDLSGVPFANNHQARPSVSTSPPPLVSPHTAPPIIGGCANGNGSDGPLSPSSQANRSALGSRSGSTPAISTTSAVPSLQSPPTSPSNQTKAAASHPSSSLTRSLPRTAAAAAATVMPTSPKQVMKPQPKPESKDLGRPPLSPASRPQPTPTPTPAPKPSTSTTSPTSPSRKSHPDEESVASSAATPHPTSTPPPSSSAVVVVSTTTAKSFQPLEPLPSSERLGECVICMPPELEL